MPISVALAAATDTGLVRSENQDHVIIGDLDSGEQLALDERHTLEVADDGRGPLFIVCDGMGGGEHGTVASRSAAETAWRELAAEAATDERLVFARQLRRSIRAANLSVRSEAKRLGSKQMGTTAAVAGITHGALVLALVGDCRAYVYRGDKLTQVTRDQSVVSALVSAGALTSEEARSSERRHMILQALGPEADVEVSLSLLELRRGDRLLLSSDGLHGVLDDRLISTALAAHDDERAALERLFELAHRAGAPDNISAVLARVEGDGLPESRGVDQVPRFTELDPREEGEAALTSTSRVARRLAHRAGIRRLTGGGVAIPATGTHAVITMPTSDDESGPMGGRDSTGPAQRRLADGASIHWMWWVIAAVTVVVLAWWLAIRA